MKSPHLNPFIIFSLLGLLGLVSGGLYSNLPNEKIVVDCFDNQDNVINELTCVENKKIVEGFQHIYVFGIFLIWGFLGTFAFGLMLLIK